MLRLRFATRCMTTGLRHPARNSSVRPCAQYLVTLHTTPCHPAHNILPPCAQSQGPIGELYSWVNLTRGRLPFNVRPLTQAAIHSCLFCIKVAATALKGKSGGIVRPRCPRNGTRRDVYIARLCNIHWVKPGRSIGSSSARRPA